MELTREQSKEMVRRGGSAQTQEQPDVPFVTTVDKKNYVSSWVVVPASKAKINYEEVEKAVDINITELRPNIPQSPIAFISKEQYDGLLSQSIDLNETITQLRDEVVTLNSRNGDLQTRTDSEISEKLSLQQTNVVLVNQLTSLSDTINGFGEQIASAVQKSVEESIFRASLQAQNEGFKAQIQALIAQSDSLNAIITGLYGQLGAATTQQEIENDAQSLAQSTQGFQLNNVVIKKSVVPTDGSLYSGYEYYGHVNNLNGDFYWKAGGDLSFQNINNLDADVNITIYYPKESPTGTPQKFFKFQSLKFTIQGKSSKTLSAIYTKDGIQSGLIGDKSGWTGLGGQPHSIAYKVGGQIIITVKIQGFADVSKTLNLGLGIQHPSSY